jgi:branched-chain amino acid transport system permease protein
VGVFDLGVGVDFPTDWVVGFRRRREGMNNKLLSTGEILGIVLIGFLSLIMGGWTIIPLAILAGAMVGLAVPQEKRSIGRAIVIGLIAALVVAACAYVRNELISQLPKQEEIKESAKAPTVYVIAVMLGVLASLIVAWLRIQPSESLRKWGLLAFVGACAVAFPFYDAKYELFWASTMIVALIFCLQALGLNIVSGYAGLLDLGYVAFFAIGGYTIALLKSPHTGLNVEFWIIIWIAAAAAAFFGLVLGAPTLPLRGDYLAIVTLGFGEIVPIVFRNLEAVQVFEPISRFLDYIRSGLTNINGGTCLVGCPNPANWTNGTQGLNPIGQPELFKVIVDFFNVFGIDVAFKVGNYPPWYFLILLLLVLSAFFIGRMRNSRIGRGMVAMREDELAASSMGIPLVKTKLTAFMIGALFSGFAGAFYGSYVSFISPDAFDFSISVIVLCMVILGGTGNIVGVILGGLIIKIVDLLLLDKLQLVLNGVLRETVFKAVQNEALNNFMANLFDATQYKLMLFGIILVVMMLVRPQGLVPEAMTKKKGT